MRTCTLPTQLRLVLVVAPVHGLRLVEDDVSGEDCNKEDAQSRAEEDTRAEDYVMDLAGIMQTM